jgi:DNA-binding XRE family transcriptional regulator
MCAGTMPNDPRNNPRNRGLRPADDPAYARREPPSAGEGRETVAEPLVTFAGLLRTLRTKAALTQEELAEASGVRPRTVSDLERGVATTPQRETIRRLADALGLAGPDRTQFEAVARGRVIPVLAGQSAAATRTQWRGRDA